MSFAGHSIASYFGEFCTGNDFAYDRMLQALYPDPPPPQEDDNVHDTQASEQASLTTIQPQSSPVRRLFSDSLGADDVEQESSSPAHKRARTADQSESQHSTASHIMETDSAVRWDAYNRTLDRLYDGDWGPLPLLSTTDHHSKMEQEL